MIVFEHIRNLDIEINTVWLNDCLRCEITSNDGVLISMSALFIYMNHACKPAYMRACACIYRYININHLFTLFTFKL